MAIVIRRVRPEDAALLREVRLAALLDAPSAFGSRHEDEVLMTDEQWTERARNGSAGVDRTTFFAVDAARVVGLVGGYREAPDASAMQLVSMWTSPGVRRRGVGRLLVQAVLDWALRSGASTIGLWATRGNDPAQQLYESMGFIETGDHQPLPSDPCRDEVRMTGPR